MRRKVMIVMGLALIVAWVVVGTWVLEAPRALGARVEVTATAIPRCPLSEAADGPTPEATRQLCPYSRPTEAAAEGTPAP